MGKNNVTNADLLAALQTLGTRLDAVESKVNSKTRKATSKATSKTAKPVVKNVTLTKRTRDAFVKVAPWARGMGTKAIRDAINGDPNLLPDGWDLPTGYVHAVIEANKAKTTTPKKKAKRTRKTQAVVAVVEVDEDAKGTPLDPNWVRTARVAEGPRDANGGITPKNQWALRERLALETEFNRQEIDAVADQQFPRVHVVRV